MIHGLAATTLPIPKTSTARSFFLQATDAFVCKRLALNCDLDSISFLDWAMAASKLAASFSWACFLASLGVEIELDAEEEPVLSCCSGWGSAKKVAALKFWSVGLLLLKVSSKPTFF